MRCGASEVDVDHHVPAALVHVGEQLVAGDAGVVDDDVRAAVPFEDELGELVGGVGRGDVQGEGRAADLVRGLRQRLAGGRDVGADDVRAVAGEDLGDGRADTAGRTGDDGDLARRAACPSPAGATESSAPTRMTWPLTNADLADSRNRSVDSRPDSPAEAFGET